MKYSEICRNTPMDSEIPPDSLKALMIINSLHEEGAMGVQWFELSESERDERFERIKAIISE